MVTTHKHNTRAHHFTAKLRLPAGIPRSHERSQASAADGGGGGGATQGRRRLRRPPPRYRSEGQGQRKLPPNVQPPKSFTPRFCDFVVRSP